MITKHITTPRLAALLLAAFGLFYWLMPSPPPAQAQFAEQRTWGGTAGGTANAITVTIANMTPTVGVPIRFIAGNNNTADTTLNLSGAGAVQIRRNTNVGVQPLVGGEINTGAVVSAVYTGSVWLLLDRYDNVGTTAEFRGAPPRGWLIEDGSCQLQATYPSLFAAIGTTYGSCPAGQFGLADPRGRVTAAPDNQGTAGSAGRITFGGSGCVATAPGLSCGTEAHQLTSTNQFPPFTIAGTIGAFTPAGTIGQITPAGTIGQITPAGTTSGAVSVSDTRTWATVAQVVQVAVGGFIANDVGAQWGAGQASVGSTGGSISSSISNLPLTGTPVTPVFTGAPVTPVFTGAPVTPIFTGASYGASTPIPHLMPVLFVARAVKL